MKDFLKMWLMVLIMVSLLMSISLAQMKDHPWIIVGIVTFILASLMFSIERSHNRILDLTKRVEALEGEKAQGTGLLGADKEGPGEN